MKTALLRLLGLVAACTAASFAMPGCGERQTAGRKPDEAASPSATSTGSTRAAQKGTADSNGPAVAAIGQKCPPFSYELIDGGTVDLSTYKGKHLILYVTSYT